jgi:hypothetical protein
MALEDKVHGFGGCMSCSRRKDWTMQAWRAVWQGSRHAHTLWWPLTAYGSRETTGTRPRETHLPGGAGS